MKMALRKTFVMVGAIVVTLIVAFDAICITRTVQYMNRGFSLHDAVNWTADEVRETVISYWPKKVEEQSYYPMANANISWDLLWKKP